jgi:hypothetical protein
MDKNIITTTLATFFMLLLMHFFPVIETPLLVKEKITVVSQTPIKTFYSPCPLAEVDGNLIKPSSRFGDVYQFNMYLSSLETHEVSIICRGRRITQFSIPSFSKDPSLKAERYNVSFWNLLLLPFNLKIPLGEKNNHNVIAQTQQMTVNCGEISLLVDRYLKSRGIDSTIDVGLLGLSNPSFHSLIKVNNHYIDFLNSLIFFTFITSYISIYNLTDDIIFNPYYRSITPLFFVNTEDFRSIHLLKHEIEIIDD